MADDPRETMPLTPEVPEGELESLARRLERHFGMELDPRVTLPVAPGTSPQTPSAAGPDVTERPSYGPEGEGPKGEGHRSERPGSETSEESSARPPVRRGPEGRYADPEEIARGGMGVVCKVWDRDVRRELAMKIIRTGPERKDWTQVNRAVLLRFLEEAQITGQLEHPGIVPIHDVGLDERGRMYFTMQLVRGEELHRIFDRVRERSEGWSTTRALGVLLKVCEAMSYAHVKGVLHRDLKPANIMVGRYGEVFVMDWGVARVLDREDRHDLRPASQDGRLLPVRTDRRDDATAVLQASESGLYTMDGDVLGTPCFMPPEQAQGDLDQLDARADVYAVGAMLYQLLAGKLPYSEVGEDMAPGAVLLKVIDGPPKPLHEYDHPLPAELIAICEKAMARDLEERYASMEALADDLRAYLEHRVVRAYQTGAGAELRKWVERNRALALAISAAVLSLVLGLAAVGVVQSKGKRAAAAEREVALENARIADDNARVAEANARAAERNAEAARRERANVLRLSAFQRLADLRSEAATLWPIRPDLEERYRDWMTRAEALLAGLEPDPASGDPGHLGQLEELRQRATRTEDGWRYASEEDRWWATQVENLVSELEAFANPETGLMSGVVRGEGPGIAQRLTRLASTEAKSLSGAEAQAAWSRTIEEIAGQAEYEGLELAPQWGLRPLGPDPNTGLQEFALVDSGSLPSRDSEGRLELDPDSALVFVLLPAGEFPLGAQATSSAELGFDPQAQPEEGPPDWVFLDAFFLAKHELTQGQWLRFTGENPARYAAGISFLGRAISLEHPVESVAWNDCEAVLGRMGLGFPTEAQWEYAARAGTETPWWPGDDREYLRGNANLADQAARRAGASFAAIDDWPDFEDGWPLHAPVAALPANSFGLHGVIGNVKEWCRQGFKASYEGGVESGTGRLFSTEDINRTFRGGGFASPARMARASYRGRYTPDVRYNDLGVRPMRAIEAE